MKFLTSLLFLLFTCLTPLSAGGKVTIVFEPYAPFEAMGTKGAVGMDVEIVTTVLAKLGLEPDFKEMPWARCLEEVKTGNVDAVMSLLYKQERTLFLAYPKVPLVSAENAFFTTVDSPIQKANLQEFKAYTVGVVKGNFYGANFDNAKDIKRDETTNTEMLVQKVMAKRSELGIGNVPVIKAQAVKLGLGDKVKFLAPPASREDYFIAFSRARKQEDLAAKFSDALIEFKKTPDYKKILAKFGM